MNQPLVSIILPVYNAQNHLARCVGSICAQTYSNIEIIILNDGSRDQSLPVCEEFRAKDPRIVLVDKENSGVADTRNLGLKLAGGKYVQFVDSDDYLDPDFTAALVAAAEEHTADLVIAPYKMVIPAGASKPEQVLDKIQDELGVMSVARPPEMREYGFLPAGIYDKDTFALRLMDKPAVYPVRRDLRFHRQGRLLLRPEPAEHLPHPGPRIHRGAEQAAGVPLLQRPLHPPGHV